MDTNNADACSLKAKIMAHPHYHRLLTSYLNCQKVGAPAEVVGRLDEACTASQAAAVGGGGYIGEDPHLDQFMEAYCEMLTKYEQELTKPFQEATLFLTRAESQFKALILSSSSSSADHSVCEEGTDWHNGSSGEEDTISNNFGNDNNNNRFIDPLANDNELKVQLLRKYSGYLGSLRQEFMRKRKKGRLPKEAREQLLEWWITHYNWPYPSESQKVALAESTGLDQKQINNWFINQRKRHWKPSEDMQLAAMDSLNHHRHLYLQPQHGHYYLDSFLGNPFSMDLSSSLL